MRPTRITALATLALAAVACGIDALGTRPVDEMPDGSGSSSGATSSSSGFDPSDGGGDPDVTTNPDGPATDAAVDVTPDVAPLVPPYLILTHAPAAATAIDLTSEGTTEWAYWGYNGSTSSTRNEGAPNVISLLYWMGSSSPSTGTGFGVTHTWTNGPGNTSGSGDAYFWVPVIGTSGYLYVRAPSSTQKRFLTVIVGGVNMRGRMTASFLDDSTPEKVDTTYSNLAGTISAKYVLEYASVTTTQVELRWVPDVAAASGVQLRFTAAALR